MHADLELQYQTITPERSDVIPDYEQQSATTLTIGIQNY